MKFMYQSFQKRNRESIMFAAWLLVALYLGGAGCHTPCPQTPTSLPSGGRFIMEKTELRNLEHALIGKHGPGQTDRIRVGLAQVVAHWTPEDGDQKELAAFVMQYFISDSAVLEDTIQRLEHALEMLDGHANEVLRELSRFQELDEGPQRPIDGLLAAFSPSAHINEDLFTSKIAFVALLNFPITTLEQRVRDGRNWSRQDWALARLTGRFEYRLPSAILQEIDRTNASVGQYIDNYNIYMDRLVTAQGQSAGFPTGLKLISHWGLRDEIRGQYGKEGGLARQQMIAHVMERIIRQEIPQEVINSNRWEWDPQTNQVRQADGTWTKIARENDTRYQHFLSVFQAMKKADPYFPSLPTHIHRAFAREREMSEERVRVLLESVLTSKAAPKIAALIQKRLGRPLQPFDLWYAGFKPRSTMDESILDKITRERYPEIKSFQADLSRILKQLGFAEDVATYLADHIVVDPARGAGHAMGAKRRDDKVHLRTRFTAGNGMDYKGFNIAIHELGHNVEQVFSMSRIDHTLLEGVPNIAFTEAFAFLFQSRDLELLGKQPPADPQTEILRNLDRFWSTFEISGVSLLDMDIWHWMYDHPQASPSELRQAVVTLATNLWNRYYAPVFGVRDVILPAIYSHIIGYGLYTPDYALGYLITFQLEQYFKEHTLGNEMERICQLGRLAPDVWMQQAVGNEVSSVPLLSAAEEALNRIMAE